MRLLNFRFHRTCAFWPSCPSADAPLSPTREPLMFRPLHPALEAHKLHLPPLNRVVGLQARVQQQVAQITQQRALTPLQQQHLVARLTAQQTQQIAQQQQQVTNLPAFERAACCNTASGDSVRGEQMDALRHAPCSVPCVIATCSHLQCL